MKRLLALISLLAMIAVPAQVLAAGSVTQTVERASARVEILTFSWTGDSSDGSVPVTPSKWAVDGYVFLMVTNPGTPAPTDNYDITLTDSDGVDIMGGTLSDRDTSNAEQTMPQILTGVYRPRAVHGLLTFTITNQSVAGAKGTVRIYYRLF